MSLETGEGRGGGGAEREEREEREGREGREGKDTETVISVNATERGREGERGIRQEFKKMQKGSFVLAGGAGFCNSVRRVLLSDLKSEAPFEVEIRINTSCQTDEFIAHRIGMIPFRRVGNGDTLSLSVDDRPARSTDLQGVAFEPCVDVEIMTLEAGQSLDLTVRFDEQLCSKHARYTKCAAVGMQRLDNEGRHRIQFETLDGSDPKAILLRALDELETRANNALLDLSHSDLPPPQTMC